MTPFQQSVLKFIRKHELSMAQVFMLWRHCPNKESCASFPELSGISDSAFKSLPRTPASTAMFSASELGVVIRLANLSHDDPTNPIRFKAWSMINRCAWERAFSDSFHHKVAGRILKEANDADDLSSWVEEALSPRREFYERCLDLLVADVSRAASSISVCDDDFKSFLAQNQETKTSSHTNRPRP